MPTAFTHIFAAEVLGKTAVREKLPLRFWVLTAVCSVLPDIDILGRYFGIRYGSLLGHRGAFHSLTFALIIGILVTVFAFPSVLRFSRKWWTLLVLFFIVTASHGLLDSMTDKGMGVAFFSPFDATRYHMPWRPVAAFPLRIDQLFTRTGFVVLKGEIIWIWLPVAAIFIVSKLSEKLRKKSA